MIVALQTLIYFRQSLLSVLERLIGPYYIRFSFLPNKDNDLDDEDSEEQVFAEYDDEKGVVFFPPMYVQRYAAVNDCLLDERWSGKLQKVVDLGYHDMSFIKYLKEVPGVEHILGVDIETVPLRCSSDLLANGEFANKRETPLQITLFQGNAADPDYRLIGCDAVVAIEMIEHMMPHDLDRLVHNIFGFIQPWIAVITTPNADFNALFKSMEKNGLRRWDHLFEWTREQFNDWCSNIVTRYPNYTVSCKGIGPGPPGTLHHGCCSQLALFISNNYHKQQDLTIDSMALVKNGPITSNFCDMEGSWEYTDTLGENNMLYAPTKLNCSTFQVKSFSTTTKNLMAKNKLDSLVHTREVVDEIRQLTKMLNFDKSTRDHKQHTWNNINWGENAPYWNQYYKIVRDYNYPFETKSEECRILELISDEINRLVDLKSAEENSISCEKLEIPIDYLMTVVEHITNDVDKVKDLLEWNGYEVVDNIVVYSRLIVENISLATPDNEWQENDALSDVKKQFEFVDARDIANEKSLDKCLQRALEIKVRKLRTLLTADQDITTELDRVVCRLMKLALRTSGDQDVPPPTSWLQFKLLDLLTLTERAIERRRWHFVNNNTLTAVGYDDYHKNEDIDKLDLFKLNESVTAMEIENKYRHFVECKQSCDGEDFKQKSVEDISQLKVEDNMSETSNEFVKIYDYSNQDSDSSHAISHTSSNENYECSIVEKETTSETKFKNIAYPKLVNHSGVRSSGDTDHSLKMSNRSRYKKLQNKYNNDENIDDLQIAKIPNSLIKFCHQNMNTKGIMNGSIFTVGNNHRNTILKRSEESIAGTKESCLIEIVTDCNRSAETIALRRSIATNTNDRYLHHNCEQLSALELNADKVPYVKKDKSFTSEHLLCLEDAKSQTIFLYDINEPSTSKGVCHVNMDVQCGLDAAFICPMPSATKSLTRLSTNFTNIENAVSGEDKTTECDVFINSSVKSNGIQIKDSDIILLKNEDSFHKTHFVVNYNTVIEPNSEHLVIAETEIVNPKQPSNIIKSEDTCPDYRQNAICVANHEQYEENPSRSLLSVTCSSKEMSKGIIGPFINKEVEFMNNISLSKPTLAFGGILVHSYKDRKTCEDIIYQGDWQRFVPKTIDRKNRFDTIVFKRMMKQSYDKRKKLFLEESIQQRKLKKTEINNICNDRKQRVKIWSEKLKSNKTSSKVLLKTVKSSVLPRSKKNEYVDLNDKKALMNSSVTNEKNLVVKHMEKSYIPKYLRIRKCNFFDKLRQSIGTVNVEKRDNKRKYLHTNSRTKDIKSGLLKFIREPPQNTNYIHVTHRKALKSSSATYENNVIVKNSAKNYIPQNLKKRKLIFLNNNKLKQSIDSVNVKKRDIKRKYLLTNSKTKDIKGDLLKFIGEPRQNISYTIFRNKIDNENETNMRSLSIKNNSSIKMVRKAHSGNSSCSSTNSVRTIKQLSPNSKESQFNIKASKSNLVNKINKSSKLIKKTVNKSSPLFDNKENSPDTSKNLETENIQFLGWSKKPLMPQNMVSVHKDKLSHVDISKDFDSVDRKNCKSGTSVCRSLSLHEPSENIVSKNQVHIDNPNLVLVLESRKELNMDYKKLSSHSPPSEAIQDLDYSLDAELCTSFNSANNIANDNESINMRNEVLSIIEERLNFIKNSSNVKISISEQNESFNLEELNKSCEKVNCFTDKSLENEFTAHSMHSGSKPVDVDLISFKSFASISGYSEYFLADSELSSTLDSLEIFTSPERSMQEIFEKNNKLCIPTSEEIFTSSRSSETYVSCQIDDDNMVPQWLFHLMNQQQSDEEEPQHISPPIPLHSIPQPHLDVNGNIMEASGLGAGAGDGCGIHSDQDSSGRDTSLSSTETSSAQHSEAQKMITYLIRAKVPPEMLRCLE
ncbi:unnamed protein product [Parnassius apollo]|uniref:(apollo) hypothetical protein n=1 Tax=Parnassius apollo TaxID=110799 RepID=A0A8S3XY07_PARAO|nr:unnamed protein product [Parnassius apollo]